MITTSTKTLMLALGGAILFAAALFIPMDAYAVALSGNTIDLNMQAKAVGNQVGLLPKVIAIICYVLGTFFTVKTVMELKKAIDSPEETGTATVAGYGVAATLLILLPYITGVVAKSIGADGNTNVASSQDNFNAETMN